MDFYGDCGSNKLSFNGEVSGFEDLLDSDVWTPSSPTEQNVSKQSFIFREKETPPFSNWNFLIQTMKLQDINKKTTDLLQLEVVGMIKNNFM